MVLLILIPNVQVCSKQVAVYQRFLFHQIWLLEPPLLRLHHDNDPVVNQDYYSSVVLTMAIVEPMIRAAGIDVIWFGIFLVVVIETAQVTPPIGFNLFVLQGMTRHEIGYIARTAIPMVGLMLLMVVILVIFPELATWLPENIRQRPSG